MLSARTSAKATMEASNCHVRVGVCPADLLGVEARVEERRVRGAVVSREQLKRVRAETVVLKNESEVRLA